MENLTQSQALELIKSWGKGFWRKLPSKHARRVLGLLTMSELAKRLDLNISLISYLTRAGILPRGSVILNRRRHYSGSDVRRIEAALTDRAVNVLPRYLTAKQSDECRAAWLAGERQADIAGRYGVTQATVSRVIHGRPPKRKRPSVEPSSQAFQQVNQDNLQSNS